MVFAVGGVDKFTIVAGPFLLLCTFFSLLRQTERITVDTEIPALVVVGGVLLLVSSILPVPSPPWQLAEPPEPRRNSGNDSLHN